MPLHSIASLPVAEAERTTDDVLDELLQLLSSWAGGVRPDREAAGRYMTCRTALLAAKVPVPGFLVQCGSIYKFAEFINLYDPRLAARVAFVQSVIDECRSLPAAKRAYDIFQD